MLLQLSIIAIFGLNQILAMPQDSPQLNLNAVQEIEGTSAEHTTIKFLEPNLTIEDIESKTTA
jgi:hypothetical protein